MYTMLQCSTCFYKAHYPLSSNCNFFSNAIVHCQWPMCDSHRFSPRKPGGLKAVAIVLLISKVMSSITCNNKDKSFSHAPLNSGMTLFTWTFCRTYWSAGVKKRFRTQKRKHCTRYQIKYKRLKKFSSINTCTKKFVCIYCQID